MRLRKFIKVTAIVLASLALLVLFLVAFFLFNPFEGSLPEMRDVVPRGVDFYAHKSNLRRDFTLSDGTVAVEQFPYVPALEKIGDSPAWASLKRGSWYRDLGIEVKLSDIRAGFEQVRKDLPYLHPVDDIIGSEVQVAGRFGPNGTDDAVWCAYARVSWKGKAAFGALARGFVRDEMSKQGMVLTDDEGFYKLRMKGEQQDLFLARYLDCMMLSNDRDLLIRSLELAEGNRQRVEPLGSSSHYRDGVLEPLQRWQKQTGVLRTNVVELFLRPDTLFPKLPNWRNWPDPNKEDARNEKILASFINKDSWRFLSGSLIFEPFSISFLTHLVVNNNLLTHFQKGVFTTEATPRSEWMNQFFRMVPRDACGAAALRLPAGDFVREMVKDALVPDERDEINNALRRTGKYQGLEDLITKMELSLQPRVGIILKPNRRTQKSIETFKVKEESPFPQWAWVFWVKKGRRSDRVLNEPLKQLINDVNDNRRAIGITEAFNLVLSRGGVQSDVAVEFAIPVIPGTGSIAACTLGDYFIIGNSGPFIHSMVDAFVEGRSRRTEPDFEEFVSEMPPAVNGVVFAWGDKLREVAEDFEKFARTASRPVDAAFAVANRPRAERRVFLRPKWSGHGTKAQIPADQKEAFETEVDEEVKTLWRQQSSVDKIADSATLKQFRHFVGTFRSAYLQMVLTDTSLEVWGRVLAPEYNR